jgi:glutamyl-Q tRNA(Asp) synthetase
MAADAPMAAPRPTLAHAPAGYVGRFAPSPTGTLHMGSLVAAVGSHLDARHHGGRWLLRIEDIDPPRTVAGAADRIQQQLRAHGLHWDGDVLFQSSRSDAYLAALARLRDAGLTFHCICSRSQLGGGRYPGTCRARTLPIPDAAERLRCEPGIVHCTDLVHGEIGTDVSAQVGDFVLRRRDGLFAYQLAVVVDDAAQGITHVVRGADLLDNTPRQVLLQRSLGMPTPAYLHLPLVLAPGGAKLSKQTGARELEGRPQENLKVALRCLGQDVDALPPDGTCEEMLQRAARSWQRHRIPRMLGLGTN